MGKLVGKVALVSGSGRGIGLAIAKKLASEGASVVVNDLEESVAAAAAREIEAASGTRVAICAGDVTANGFAEQFVNTAIDRLGGLDIIVNNAGYTWDNVIQKIEDPQWDAIIDVHLKAPFRIMRAASGHIRNLARQEAERGEERVRKVVNISSTSGVFGNAGQANYAAAKAGVNGLTKAMAKEWGRYKVCVNSVAFGLIKTRLTEATTGGESTIDIAGRQIKVGISQQTLENAERAIPLGRGGTAEEAAGAVCLFCFPESDYVSGQVLVCGGGRP